MEIISKGRKGNRYIEGLHGTDLYLYLFLEVMVALKRAVWLFSAAVLKLVLHGCDGPTGCP